MKSYSALTSLWLLVPVVVQAQTYASTTASSEGTVLVADVEKITEQHYGMGEYVEADLTAAFPESNMNLLGAYGSTEDTASTAAAGQQAIHTSEETVGFSETVDISSTLTVDETETASTKDTKAQEDCPLECFNQGVCQVGDLNRDTAGPHVLAAFGIEEVEYHCECPTGWTGALCDRPYISCDGNSHACLNGGACLPSFLDEYENEQFYCDCTAAIVNGQPFAGKFCQAEAVDVCRLGGEDSIYCVNGSCKNHFLVTPTEPCQCEDGWEGPHCEYPVGEAPLCDLDCNTGICRLGKLEYSNESNMFVPTIKDHQYCVCPNGTYGPRCGSQGTPCGGDHCFNGGTCVGRLDTNGQLQSNCDCSTAVTDEVSYGGEFCEAESNAFCTRLPDHNGQQFCVNGGTCKGASHLGCDCVEGFVGPICEFEDKNLDDYTCDLKCENDGICRKGAKDITLLEQFGVNREHLNSTFNQNFEHCVCPKGYVGVRCEFKMDVCPGADHICMNGGECMPVRDSDGLHFDCDCSSAVNQWNMYAGEFCEFESTDFCTQDQKKPDRGDFNSDAFCVNNGRCRGRVFEDDEHPGCDCVQGFEGDHCEISNPLAKGTIRNRTNGGGDDDDSMSAVVIAVIVVGGLAMAAALVVGMLAAQKRRRKRTMMSPFNSRRAPPPPTLDHIRALEPWMSTGSGGSRSGSDTGSDTGSAISGMAPSSAPSRTSSRAHSVTKNLTVDNATGNVSLMKDNMGRSYTEQHEDMHDVEIIDVDVI